MYTKEAMVGKNDHIKNFLKNYVFGQSKYAVLINGHWGCGKTHFIKEQIEEWKQLLGEKNQPQQVLYVSLYGIENKTEIEHEILRQIYPLLQGKLYKGLSKTVGTLSIMAFKNEIVNDKKVLEGLSEFGEVKGHIIVLDDFERCCMPLDSLMGYINGLVEHSAHKVILVSNDSEVGSSEENKSALERYQHTKEKLVAQTFLLEPETETVFEMLWGNLPTNVQKLLASTKETILDIHIKSQSNSLRHLEYAIEGLQWLIETVDLNATESHHRTYCDLVAPIYTIFTHEMRMGNLKPNWLLPLHSVLFHQHSIERGKKILKQDYPEQHEQLWQLGERLHRTYNLDHGFSFTFSLPELESVLFERKVDVAQIHKLLDRLQKDEVREDSCWHKMKSIRMLTDEQCKELLTDCRKDLANQNRLHVLLDYYGLLISLSNIGVDLHNTIKPTTALVREAKAHFRKLIEANDLRGISFDTPLTPSEIEYRAQHSYSNFLQTNIHTPPKEFLDLVKAIFNQWNHHQKEHYIETVSRGVARLETKAIEHLIQKPLMTYTHDSVKERIPILDKVDVQTFLDHYRQSNVQFRIIKQLMDRYTPPNWIDEPCVRAEMEFFKAIYEFHKNQKDYGVPTGLARHNVMQLLENFFEHYKTV